MLSLEVPNVVKYLRSLPQFIMPQSKRRKKKRTDEGKKKNNQHVTL
jgi:hypothetical protein